MSSFKITQLVVALSLCLLLLSFSCSADAAARPVTDIAEAAAFPACVGGDHCFNWDDDKCTTSCRQKGYRWGRCFPTSSPKGEQKIDVNYAVITIAPCLVSVDGNWQFNFRRNLTGAETDMFAEFLLVIGNYPPSLDGLPDTRRWSLNGSGIFSVKSLYSKLVENYGVENFPYTFVWNKSVPPKVNFLVWCLIHEKLNTIDTMQNKGVDIYNSCVLCGDDTESQDHIFLHCKITHRIWSLVLPSSYWSWVLPMNMRMLALGWNHVHFSTSGNYIWSLIPDAIVFTIWTERNNRIFEKNYNFKTEMDLGVEVKSLILAWANAAGKEVHLNSTSSVLNNWEALFV